MTSIILDVGADRPASLSSAFGSRLLGRSGSPLVEVFTASEQRARSSQAFTRSAVGERLRVEGVTEMRRAGATVTTVVQRDPTSGLECTTELVVPDEMRVIRATTRVSNTSGAAVLVHAATSLSLGIGREQSAIDPLALLSARSEWLAENRWSSRSLRDLLPEVNLALHGQDARGHAALTSHGAWSSGEHVPMGVIVDEATGAAVAWQHETSGPWHADLSQARDGAVLSLLGPTDQHHGFAQHLMPGDELVTVPVAIAASEDGLDGVVAELSTYRRWLLTAASDHLPLVYNDFMNTLMGQPTTEALLPLIASAAEAGTEVFCIDAGWFAEPDGADWWSGVGEWREAPSRFTGGLRALIDGIHSAGMRSGLWLEPEVVGIDSPVARRLPDEAFFLRAGQRVVEDRRYHLDMRHPAARAHLDATVDHLVTTYGIGYLKLDYNINPGAGTDVAADSAAAGLLGHTIAYREWLADVQLRHPGLLLENCASGAQRADYGVLAVTHLQSTSDQQDLLLYPPIAASAPASILPEQCGNWAYPAATMTREEVIVTLVTGLSGRLYLSGFLHELGADHVALVHEATTLFSDLRRDLAQSTAVWPLGLPHWRDDTICLVLRRDARDIVYVWHRGAQAAELRLSGVIGEPRCVFPQEDTAWSLSSTPDGLAITVPAGPTARVIEVLRP